MIPMGEPLKCSSEWSEVSMDVEDPLKLLELLNCGGSRMPAEAWQKASFSREPENSSTENACGVALQFFFNQHRFHE